MLPFSMKYIYLEVSPIDFSTSFVPEQMHVVSTLDYIFTMYELLFFCRPNCTLDSEMIEEQDLN